MKSRIKKLLYGLLLIAGTGMILVSAVNIAGILWEYHKSRAEYDDLREQVFAEAELSRGEKEETQDPEGSVQDKTGEAADTGMTPEERLEYGRNVCRSVRQLQEKRKDVKGWIFFEQPDISYPIMQGEDNDAYLYHTWSRVNNASGSIFLEALNNADFQDSHTIIYGHNMKDGSMFGHLKDYRKEGFYEEASFFTIYTADRIYEYQIFAYYEIPEDSDLYTVYYNASDEFTELIRGMKKNSWLDTGVAVSAQDKVVTLSTCSTEGRRFVVNAVRTAEYEVE